MPNTLNRIYSIGSCRFDLNKRLLYRAGESVKLAPKPFELLILFIESEGRTLGKEEITKALYGDGYVQDSAYYRNISDLRKALGGDASEYIENVPTVGYRFVANVKELQRHDQYEHGLSGGTFMTWLNDKSKSALFPLPAFSTTGMREGDVVVGDAVIVNTAPSAAGYSVDLDRDQISFPWHEFDDLMTPFEKRWLHYKRKNEKFVGVKTVPVELTCPVSEDSKLRILGAEVPYGFIRAFHMLVQENIQIRDKLVKRAFEYGGRKIPGALAIDGGIILGGEPNAMGAIGNRHLLLAHRVKRAGGYYDNQWSASFEEQFNPLEFTDHGRRFASDKSLVATTTRGLKEEFLGDEAAADFRVTLQAVSVDLVNLNLQVIAIVDAPDMSFSAVRAAWSSRKPIDHNEHDVLASMRLDAETLRKALVAKCPDGLVESISNGDLEDYLKHPWHPRSQARIACCLWMLEEGLL